MTTGNSPGVAAAAVKSGVVLGATEGADSPGGEAFAGEPSVGEPAVGERAPLSGVAPALAPPPAPVLDTPPPTPGDGAGAVIGVGRTDCLARSRSRWLQKESASARTS